MKRAAALPGFTWADRPKTAGPSLQRTCRMAGSKPLRAHARFYLIRGSFLWQSPPPTAGEGTHPFPHVVGEGWDGGVRASAPFHHHLGPQKNTGPP